LIVKCIKFLITDDVGVFYDSIGFFFILFNLLILLGNDGFVEDD
jgi:hypothetical protein